MFMFFCGLWSLMQHSGMFSAEKEHGDSSVLLRDLPFLSQPYFLNPLSSLFVFLFLAFHTGSSSPKAFPGTHMAALWKVFLALPGPLC